MLPSAVLPLRRTWFAIAVAGFLGVRAVHAQGMGGAAGGMGGRNGPGRGAGDCKADATDTAQPSGPMLIHLAAGERLRSLPTELQLTSAQMPLYTRYANAVEKIMLDESTWASRPAPTTGTAMQRMGTQIDLASNRAAGWEDVLDAVKPLYASLSGSQQAIADQRLVVTLEPNAWVFAKGDTLTAPTSQPGRPSGAPPDRAPTF